MIGRPLLRAIVDEWRFLAGRGRSTLIVLLGIPFFYPVVIAWLYAENQPVERPILVVDDDNSALSRRLVTDLEATHELRIVGRPATAEEGFHRILQGDAEAVVWIPPDLATDVKQGRQGHVKVWVNAGNMLTYSVAYAAISNVMQHLTEDLDVRYFVEKGIPRDAATNRVMPILRDDRILFRPDLSYGSYLVPGVMMVVLQQLILVALAFSCGMAREFHLTWPGTEAATAWGKVFGQFPVYMLGAAFLALFLFPLCGWPDARPGALLVVMTAFLVAMVPVAVLVAGPARDRYYAFLMLMLLSSPIFMASGYAWPMNHLPTYIQVLTLAIPLRPALSAMQLVSVKGCSLGEVAPQLLHLGALAVGWTLVTLVFQWLAARFRGGRASLG
ncbi:MAG TPA: ABC transporter permease [Myxococcota bacterium]|nr:ABC transporter permease [Myxococcota bacterium]HQK51888.1 ABC transporter permease [Myxococcota bacterium]